MSGQSQIEFGVCSNQDGLERLVRALRKLHPVKTADAVQAETGIPSTTVGKWLALQSSPSLPAFARLVFAYGPDVVSALFRKAPAWLDAAARAQRLAALDAQLAALQSEKESLL